MSNWRRFCLPLAGFNVNSIGHFVEQGRLGWACVGLFGVAGILAAEVFLYRQDRP